MIRKLTLVAAFGAGYVLGAKAGKERYAQIAAGVQDLVARPAVQNATEKVKDKATTVAADAVETVKDKATTVATDAVETVKDKVTSSNDPVIDLNEAPSH